MVICDMDGTLIEEEVTYNGEVLPSRWTQIAMSLGDDAYKREQDAIKKWHACGYDNPVDFLDEAVQIFSDFGLEEDYFREVIDSYEYFPGVKDVFSELGDRENYMTALISGGFKALADRVSEELGIDYTRAACELEWGPQGNLVGWDLSRTDYGSKVDSLKEIIEKCDADVSDCVYVGNGNNDVSVAKYVVDNGGTAISFNGTPELREVCTYSVVQPRGEENFLDVLKYMDFERTV